MYLCAPQMEANNHVTPFLVSPAVRALALLVQSPPSPIALLLVPFAIGLLLLRADSFVFSLQGGTGQRYADTVTMPGASSCFALILAFLSPVRLSGLWPILLPRARCGPSVASMRSPHCAVFHRA